MDEARGRAEAEAVAAILAQLDNCRPFRDPKAPPATPVDYLPRRGQERAPLIKAKPSDLLGLFT